MKKGDLHTLPSSGIIDGKIVLNYDLLPKEILLADGWVDDDSPTANELIVQASAQCKERIVSGFDSECLGEVKHFDSTMEDQATIQGLTLTAIMGLNGLTTEETHWKGTGELECYKFEYVQMLKLAEDLKRHVEKNINQFNAERLAILNGVTD